MQVNSVSNALDSSDLNIIGIGPSIRVGDGSTIDKRAITVGTMTAKSMSLVYRLMSLIALHAVCLSVARSASKRFLMTLITRCAS